MGQLLGGVLHRPNDLVVARAAAQVAGEPIANGALVGVRVAVQQGLGSDDEAGGANAALQRRMLEKLLLNRVQAVALGDAFNGGDLGPFRLRSQHQAGADQAAIDDHRAGTAVASAAAFLGAELADLVAQRVEQGLLRRAEKIDLIAVDGGADVHFAHGVVLLSGQGAVAGDGPGAPAKDGDDLAPVFDGAALVVNG